MILVKNNLCIRNAEAKDAEQLCIWWNDGKVMAHAGFPDGLNETPENIRNSLLKDHDETGRRHIIEISGRPAGEMNYRSLGGSTAEIGIKICDAAEQGKGYGTVILTIFIDALFAYYGYKKIVLDTNAENQRAQHIYEKLGFRRTALRENAWQDAYGRPQSCVDYELTREAWHSWIATQDTPQDMLLNYIHIRLERPEDYRAAEEPAREAYESLQEN